MRTLRRLAWVAVAAAGTASPAAAQMATGGNLGAATTSNAQTIGGNLAGLNTAATTPTAGTNSTSGTTSGSNNSPALTAVESAPQIKAPSTYGTTNPNKTIQSSNFLAPSFANPYYQGVLAKARTGTTNPGGFGDLTFGTATGATATPGGARGGTTGTGQTTDPGGQLVTLPRQIAYPAQLKFAVAPIVAPRLQADLRGLLDRAPSLANPAGVQVQVDGNMVVLRGAVKDGDEARLVEGLVRLTPGVGRIANELTYPR